MPFRQTINRFELLANIVLLHFRHTVLNDSYQHISIIVIRTYRFPQSTLLIILNLSSRV